MSFQKKSIKSTYTKNTYKVMKSQKFKVLSQFKQKKGHFRKNAIFSKSGLKVVRDNWKQNLAKLYLSTRAA